MNKHSVIVCVLCIYNSRRQDSTVVFQQCSCYKSYDRIEGKLWDEITFRLTHTLK